MSPKAATFSLPGESIPRDWHTGTLCPTYAGYCVVYTARPTGEPWLFWTWTLHGTRYWDGLLHRDWPLECHHH